MAPNLYVHFPFCRRKCSYCTLYSRCDVSAADRAQYVETLVRALDERAVGGAAFATVYFGGGSPALCDLGPLLKRLADGLLASGAEFTVELHPCDVTDDLLMRLRDGGVNRISMGVQSLDDAVLEHMGRGYTAVVAAKAFGAVRRRFDNAGIDLIVGYPGEPDDVAERCRALADWGLRHASVYSLQNERGLKGVPDDETTLDRLRAVADVLETFGLMRYEISNYAQPGFECRHNLAVWNGEDYLGLGAGACGRLGLRRTRNWGLSPFSQGGLSPFSQGGLSPVRSWWGQTPSCEIVTCENDEKERRFFRLRTRAGLSTTGHPEWDEALKPSVRAGLLRQNGDIYCLTKRGCEVCDSILLDLL